MAQEQQKKKKGPPEITLPNKQIMPLMALGTSNIRDQELLTELLRKGLELGYCKHIDTSRYFGNQIPLGRAIATVIKQGRVKRQELFIGTSTFNHKMLNPLTELKQALRLMDLKYVDIYYLNWPASDMTREGKQWTHRSLKQVWEDMESCVRRGYAKNIGVANFNGQLLGQLLSYSKIKPTALQIEVHPYFPQDGLINFAKKKGIQVMAHSSLGKGSTVEDQNCVIKEEILGDIANKYGKTAAQVALKSTLNKGVGVITGTTNLAHLKENAQAWKIQLSQDDNKKIRNVQKVIRTCDGRQIFKSFSVFEY